MCASTVSTDPMAGDAEDAIALAVTPDARRVTEAGRAVCLACRPARRVRIWAGGVRTRVWSRAAPTARQDEDQEDERAEHRDRSIPAPKTASERVAWRDRSGSRGSGKKETESRRYNCA